MQAVMKESDDEEHTSSSQGGAGQRLPAKDGSRPRWWCWSAHGMPCGVGVLTLRTNEEMQGRKD